MTNLWSSNTPAHFWLCQQDIPDDQWAVAIQKSLPVLGLSQQPGDMEELLALVIGEGDFGSNHWKLSLARRWYYRLKPLVPRSISCFLRRILSNSARCNSILGWPIEDRYARFQWEVMRQLLIITGQAFMGYYPLWPDGQRFAFVITHDIETAQGQENAWCVADLEENLGFRSSFNFVPERYKPNYKLMDNLRQRGFEVGVHGLRHDGRLLDSKSKFLQNANRINGYLKEWKATGFRSPLTHRNPEWMQALEIEYDLSFFDTDPFEPIPGGTMSIWPFSIGHFMELPYTLVQDYTLTSILKETTPRIWLEKVDFIEKYHGMALVNTHPDYLKNKLTWKVYYEFLNEMQQRDSYWHALPCEVARWWRARSGLSSETDIPGIHFSKVFLDSNGIRIEI